MPFIAVAVAALSVAAFAQAPEPEKEKLQKDDLVYSVDRTPERVFDTARSVEVITGEQIQHLNVQTLAQLLEVEPGFNVQHTIGGAMPMVRGLAGKQVLIMIDGARVNNGTWRLGSKEYLGIIDLSQVDRIEIVRGVVSVLGTDALGGVINIITKKGPPNGDNVGGTITSRYASAERAWGTPISVYGSVGSKFRFDAGGNYTDARKLHPGGGLGAQEQSAFTQQAGHINGQWLLSPEKTLGFGYQNARFSQDEQVLNAITTAAWDPAQMQLLNVSYLDLTDRGWSDSLRATVYANEQVDRRHVTLFSTHQYLRQNDRDKMVGANVELGTFVGSSHLVYGVDYTNEHVESTQTQQSIVTGAIAHARGNFIDGSSYRTTSAYVNDRADLGKWLTAIGGLRLGRFEKSGDSVTGIVASDIGSKNTNVTGALNLIGHLSPQVNLIANAVKGYRSPNLDDVSHYLQRNTTAEVPNPDARPEKVLSTELGVKLDFACVKGSAFYFRNKFKDLLVRTNGTYNGLPFVDENGNGKLDPGERAVLQNLNVGQATIKGYELDFNVPLAAGLFAVANYSHVTGTDEVHNAPLAQVPPASGRLGLRYFGATARRIWAETDFVWAQAQHRIAAADIADPNLGIGAAGWPAYHVVNLRTGFDVTNMLGLSAGIENITDEKYRELGSVFYQPGRQLVLGAQLHF